MIIGTEGAFFALEACRAGSLFGSLSERAGINPEGYLFSEHLSKPARQFLTAGDSDQSVPANGLFTGMLVQGMEEADTNNDGYVTGSELISYVSHGLPQHSQTDALNPESEIMGKGDMIIGPSLAPQHSSPGAPVTNDDHEASSTGRVSVASNISGQLVGISVAAGQAVGKGDDIFRLDPRPAQAALAKSMAQRQQHQVLLFKAQNDWFDLHKKRPAETTQDEVATAILIVKRYEAMIASDNADLQLNRVNLNYTIGRAPTCGRVDKVIATPGDYLEVGSPVVRLLTTGCGESRSSNTIERRNSPAAAPSTSGPTTTAADPSPPQIPDADSGWVGGGLSPTKFCDPLLAMYKAKYPSFDVTLHMPAERHDATYSLVGGKHDIYRYACSFVAKKK